MRKGIIKKVTKPEGGIMSAAVSPEKTRTAAEWMKGVIKPEEYEKYLVNGRDFIDDENILSRIEANKNPDPKRIREIFAKSLAINTLDLDETAMLLNMEDPDLIAEMFELAGEIKRKVYDNRIVTFAPLYCSNLCVNNCSYCGFRTDNTDEKRRRLSMDEIVMETRALAGEIGHKRIIAVYGEHHSTDADYIAESIKTIYDVEARTRTGRMANIRRVNINAAPMCIEDLRKLHEVGIGTYQVFQETYHHETYSNVHPRGTLKGDYRWRLYCHHRAMEGGVDDVALGALFGLYDWRFEVMALVAHARDLERCFNGLGPHTISFPRLEPAANTPYSTDSKYLVPDEYFKKLVAVIRLAVPYTGMILTARESAQMRREVLPLGVTQTDSSTKIGIGAYSERYSEQEAERQQFILGDTRSLDEVVREYCDRGYITSFCTAGYRCGRTGDHIMKLLKCGKEGHMCKLNAVLTFREWLDDFASPETKAAGEALIKREIEEIKVKLPKAYASFIENYSKVVGGAADIFF
jgi:2-iminoacetate synthase